MLHERKPVGGGHVLTFRHLQPEAPRLVDRELVDEEHLPLDGDTEMSLEFPERGVENLVQFGVGGSERREIPEVEEGVHVRARVDALSQDGLLLSGHPCLQCLPLGSHGGLSVRDGYEILSCFLVE